MDLLDYSKGDEIPLITHFLCCHSLKFGINVIGIVDIFAAMFWLVLLIGFHEDWYLWLIYLSVGVFRIFYWYQLRKEDEFHTRRNYYFTHLVSNICYFIVFIIHFFVSWVKYDEFPIVFMLWQIVMCFIMLYLLLVVR